MANLTDVLNFRSNLTGADIKSLYEAEPNAFVDSDKSKIDSLYYVPTPTITTNYDAADKDEVRCDSSGGTFTITLPASGSVKIVDIIGVDADTGFGATGLHVTLVPQPGGTTILGETSLDLDVGASRLVFTLYGSDWKLIDVSAPRFVVSDWNDLNNKPNFVDGSTVSTSYDGTNVSSEIIFPVSGASFTAPLTLPNNSRINGVEHFYQTTKPTVRGDASALVAGDRWWKTDDGTEWFWNGTYWLSVNETALGHIGNTSTLSSVDPIVENKLITKGAFDYYPIQGGEALLYLKQVILKIHGNNTYTIDENNKFDLYAALIPFYPDGEVFILTLDSLSKINAVNGITNSVTTLDVGSTISQSEFYTIQVALLCKNVVGTPSLGTNAKWNWSFILQSIYP